MIYFVEDDENIRKLVAYALNKDNIASIGFERADFFWQALNDLLPDLILLDIMLPEEDGIITLKKLKSDNITKNIPVIMLSARSSEFDKVNCLDLGADDYIVKPFGMVELVSRIQAVLRRYQKSTHDTTEDNIYIWNSIRLDMNKYEVTVGEIPVNLAYKEYSILLELISAKGNVVRRDYLLRAIWGDFYDNSRTLDVHMRKLRKKLELAGDVIQTVKNVGYKLKDIS